MNDDSIKPLAEAVQHAVDGDELHLKSGGEGEGLVLRRSEMVHLRHMADLTPFTAEEHRKAAKTIMESMHAARSIRQKIACVLAFDRVVQTNLKELSIYIGAKTKSENSAVARSANTQVIVQIVEQVVEKATDGKIIVVANSALNTIDKQAPDTFLAKAPILEEVVESAELADLRRNSVKVISNGECHTNGNGSTH